MFNNTISFTILTKDVLMAVIPVCETLGLLNRIDPLTNSIVMSWDSVPHTTKGSLKSPEL